MRRLSWFFAALAAALVKCSSTTPGPSGAVFDNQTGTASVEVQANPFAIVVRNAQGTTMLESAPAQPGGPYAPLAIANEQDDTTTTLVTGWDYYKGEYGPWTQVSQALSVTSESGTTTVSLATGLPAQPTMTVTIASDGIGVRITASVDGDPNAGGDSSINRVSMAFVLHDDDHFFGLGERFVGADQRGQYRYMWVEDRFGSEDSGGMESSAPTALQGEETYVPIPWMMDPRGFGVLQQTTFRTVYHLGDEVSNAYRLEEWEPKIDFSVFVDDDPKNLVAALTNVTGRPPDVPDWIFAPRRRADIPVDDEVARLRSAHIPTTAIDTALHYLPDGIGTLDAKSVTADIHARGFKAIAYFCSFINQDYHPVFDQAVANNYLVKKQDGTPYVVFNIPRYEGIVDFTNPDAVTWYQGLLTQAVNDGWDGWMYDFAEYIPQDAVMFNGMTGFEAHDLYPVLYDKAAHDVLEQLLPQNYMFFARSGFAGTGGYAPLVWSGDADTDFNVGRGLPANVAAALNAGMSGIPFWGSDISGYDYLYNPPPDKELYLRWTEFGALSADMHDENEGVGNLPVSARWQIWDDQETTTTYQTYARLHTELAPYIRVAVNEARATGIPMMRHLYLYFPHDPNVWSISDEYMFGDSLLVAPIVARGAVSRSVYLPEPAYYDFFSGARVAGPGLYTANATLDQLPLFARLGAIIPMLSPDVETLMPKVGPFTGTTFDANAVVSITDRADVLYVELFTGGSTSVVLGDATTLAQTAPTAAYEITTPPAAQNATLTQATQLTDLTSCDACFLDDPTSRTLSITLKTSADVITAGPATVTISQSPNVKRFVMHLHH